MPSLKEIKSRISSVKTTLKITSAMKLVSSAKLKRAQSAIGNMLPYHRKLNNILLDLLGNENDDAGIFTMGRKVHKVAIVAFCSNSSLCGGFNGNAIRNVHELINKYKEEGITDITVYSIGKRMAEAMNRMGYPSPYDYNKGAEKPSYEVAALISEELMKNFSPGKFDKVELVYNHYKSNAEQPTVIETFLPLSFDKILVNEEDLKVKELSDKSGESEDNLSEIFNEKRNINTNYILEPDRKELIEILLPKVLKIKIFSVMLDTNAAEHAARTVAMQVATDNGQDLLGDLTLDYNKGRQQKITSEILDLVGGAIE